MALSGPLPVLRRGRRVLLAEMVRQRLGIAEEASASEASARLSAGLERWIADLDERRRVAEALGPLIGTADPGLERAELFAGWRLPSSGSPSTTPLCWPSRTCNGRTTACSTSSSSCLTGPPITRSSSARSRGPSSPSAERNGRPACPPGPRCASSRSPPRPRALLRGLVAELPARARRRIADQAEGTPLYAVETVRALSDWGILNDGDGRLELAEDIGELDVPASLHSCSPPASTRSSPTSASSKAMAVFGGSSARPWSRLADLPEGRVDDVLTSLVARDIFTIRTDPLA